MARKFSSGWSLAGQIFTPQGNVAPPGPGGRSGRPLLTRSWYFWQTGGKRCAPTHTVIPLFWAPSPRFSNSLPESSPIITAILGFRCRNISPAHLILETYFSVWRGGGKGRARVSQERRERSRAERTGRRPRRFRRCQNRKWNREANAAAQIKARSLPGVSGLRFKNVQSGAFLRGCSSD